MIQANILELPEFHKITTRAEYCNLFTMVAIKIEYEDSIGYPFQCYVYSLVEDKKGWSITFDPSGFIVNKVMYHHNQDKNYGSAAWGSTYIIELTEKEGVVTTYMIEENFKWLFRALGIAKFFNVFEDQILERINSIKEELKGKKAIELKPPADMNIEIVEDQEASHKKRVTIGPEDPPEEPKNGVQV